jgi:hypothetical protein
MHGDIAGGELGGVAFSRDARGVTAGGMAGFRGGRGQQADFADAQLGNRVRLGGVQIAARSGDVDANGLAEYSSMTLARQGTAANGGFFYAPANADDLANLVAQDQRHVIILDKSGSMRNLSLFLDAGQAQRNVKQVAAELNKAGAVLLPALRWQETGYWNPAVVTGEDGKATVTIAVPERSTAWKLMAKGITTETLAGEATDELTVKKDLFGQLKLPLSFTDGDQADVLASVHNDAVEEGQIEVTLKTTIAGRTIEEKKTLDVKAKRRTTRRPRRRSTSASSSQLRPAIRRTWSGGRSP